MTPDYCPFCGEYLQLVGVTGDGRDILGCIKCEYKKGDTTIADRYKEFFTRLLNEN